MPELTFNNKLGLLRKLCFLIKTVCLLNIESPFYNQKHNLIHCIPSYFTFMVLCTVSLMCVCVYDRERQTERERGGEREGHMLVGFWMFPW